MSLALFDYQEAILDKLRAGFIAGHRHQLLVAPTGAGKTEMAIELLEATANKGNRAAMVLDRRVLCDQTSDRLAKYDIEHGVLMAKHWRYRPEQQIQICSAATLEKRGGFPNMSLMIVDEAHTPRKKTLEFIAGHPNVYVVGLTATPFRKGLGKVFTNVVSAVTTRELVERGRLAPLKVYIAKEIDMDGAKKVAGEWSKDESEQRGMQITGDIVAEWVSKTQEVFGGPRKTIVFAAGVEHAADLSRKFAEAGYNFIALSYKDDEEFKDEVIEDFAKPDTQIHGLIATDILTKGFDVPDVMVGISARPFSKSLGSHIQQMGRVMRSHPGKEFALWLCHSGNYLRFQEEWDDIYANGITKIDEGREKPQRELTKKEKEAMKCPKCSRLWPPGRVDTCPSCGFVFAGRSEIIHVPGSLEALGQLEKSKANHWERVEFLGGLRHIAQERGYAPGWVSHKFKDKFGVWPNNVHADPMPPSQKVRNFLKSQAIANAHRRQREEAMA